MQIHVVLRGQTLFGIANAYGTSVAAIAEANQISPADTLVVGQTLVIPITGRFYWVVAGDSLYSIARRFGTDVQTLARINRINPNAILRIDTRLYLPPRVRRAAEVNAYIEPFGQNITTALQNTARDAAPLLTYLAPFSFTVNRDGTLNAPPLDNLQAIAQSNNVTLMLVVTNLENGQFSAELGSAVLGNPAVSETLIDNIISTANRLGFRDIHFDFEHLAPADREKYNEFLRRAVVRLHEQGFLMSTALAPKTSAGQEGPWYTAHDYRVHGEVADFVVIMTYEWGYSGGPPMPVSPIGPVRNVLEYALTEIPASKILMGQNLYGYDWTLPFVAGERYARAISPQQAIAIARENNAEIFYDYTAQAPNFDYWTSEGDHHKVWFEDARSIQAKFDLLKELNLRGISYWKLGLSFPQNWLLLRENFDVIKRS